MQIALHGVDNKMSLVFFKNTPISIATQIGLNDYFTGTGSATDFDMVNKSYSDLANIVQIGSEYRKRSTRGISAVDSDTFRLNFAPANGVKGVAPASSYGQLVAADTDIPGVSNAQIKSGIFHIADIADIANYSYKAVTGDPGIEVFFTNQIPAATGAAATSWLRFAPLHAADMSIDTGNWTEFGDSLFLSNDIEAYSTVDSASLAGDTTIDVVDASDFVAGQWIRVFNDGDTDMDIVWVTSIVGDTLHLLQPLAYDHAVGIDVFACGTSFAAEVHVPDDAGGGISQTFFNLSLDRSTLVFPR